ncbi:MAG: hypothetical protein IPM86_09625 [Saprospiraceae bacterium]|nr:hypothetical protein [Saprospiraceae bacterium]
MSKLRFFILNLIVFRFLKITVFLVLVLELSGQDLLVKRNMQISHVLRDSFPVIRLVSGNQSEEFIAQELFLNYPKTKSYFSEEKSGKPYLNEIFSVSKIRPSDLPPGQKLENPDKVYRVELYNFGMNQSLIGLVDVEKTKVVYFHTFENFQPDIPPHLAALAEDIALSDPDVIKQYGQDLDPLSVRMSSTKTALNRSSCQRSQHLCVAPTFVKNERAMWVIVDLTSLKVVGVKWTEVGKTGPAITERMLQNEKVMTCYCEVENKVSKNGWSFLYTLTRSDGLRVSNISFKGIPLYRDVKTVDWHVSYSNTEGFGYSDAIGCPEYSQAAVVAVEPPVIYPIIENQDTVGFGLSQKYFSEGWPTPCSYNYEQHFEFFNDGSFRPVIGSIGRGCGNDGTYRPVTRISFFSPQMNFYSAQKNKWKKWSMENWALENFPSEYFKNKYLGKFTTGSKSSEIWIEGNRGQFGDGGRGDKAYFYLTKDHPNQDEGTVDLPTIGPCCNLDYKQGPDKFIDPQPEPIENSALVFWYVPQIKNDDRKGNEYCWAESVRENGVFVPTIYPCFSGPKFILK